MKEILLITGKDCHLCSEARSLLLSIQTDNFEFREVDIYSKRAYVDKYWDKIPVILKQESELLWPFNIEDLKKFLITDIKKFQ